MNVKSMVEKVLRERPETRNSDKALLMAIRWEYYREAFHEIDGVWYIRADRLQDMPTPEAVTRSRRKFQEPTDEFPEGQYPPTDPKVLQKRRKNESITTFFHLLCDSVTTKIPYFRLGVQVGKEPLCVSHEEQQLIY